MPTKRELLEEKTVKELKQMAREKGLTGYSKMRKDELVDLVEENYTEAEIKAYSEAARESAGEAVSLSEKLSSNLLVIAVSIGVVAVLVGFVLGYMEIGREGSTADYEYTNENYGFAFNYPSGWIVEEGNGNTYQVYENVPENQKEGYVWISIQNLIQGKARSIDGFKGIEVSFTSSQFTMSGTVTLEMNQIILPKNNKIYMAGARSLENKYENYKPDFSTILDSLTFSKSNLSPSDNKSTENYMNENYGIYFNYPSEWTLQSSSQENYLFVSMGDNTSGGTMGAQAIIQIASVDKASSREINGFPGVEFTSTGTSQGGGPTKSRSLFAVKENRLYSVGASAPENAYENYKPQFGEIIESFTFLK